MKKNSYYKKSAQTATLKKVDNLYMVFAVFHDEYQEVFQSWNYQDALEYATIWYEKVKNEVTASQGRTLRNYGAENDEGYVSYTDYDMAGNKIGEGTRCLAPGGRYTRRPEREARVSDQIYTSARTIYKHYEGDYNKGGHKIYSPWATRSCICPRDTIDLLHIQYGKENMQIRTF